MTTTVVEISFNSLGPLVAFSGTLRPLHRAHFVESLAATVIPEKDNATHRFQWAATRTIGIQMGWDPSKPPPPVEYPAPFLAELNEPHAISPVFSVAELRKEIEAISSNLNKEWTTFFEQDRLSTPNDDIEAGFERFRLSGKMTPFWAEIDKRMYWQSGAHRLEISVTASEPNRQYQFAWNFHMSGSDVENIKSNNFRILRQACGMPNPGFNSAFPQLRRSTKEPYLELPPPRMSRVV